MALTRGPTVTTAHTGPAARFAGLDGLRGIAILAVMGYHFGVPFLTGGYLGVDVFFAVSGFVVTRNLTRLMAEKGWARSFYGRRVSRLYPTLCSFLLALTIYWIARGEFGGDAVIALAGAGLMSFNLAATLFGAELAGPLPLWSLAVEWHFYLILPVLLAIGRSRIGPIHRAIGLAALAGSIALARLVALTVGDIGSFDIYIATWFRMDGLLLGAAVAFLAPGARRLASGGWITSLAVLGVTAAMVIGPNWGARAPITLGLVVPFVGLLTAIAVTAIVGRETSAPLRGLERPLNSPVLLWAGQRSYSLYLWHYFVGVLIIGGSSESWLGPGRFSAQVLASVLAAELSFRFVEQPARLLINRRL